MTVKKYDVLHCKSTGKLGKIIRFITAGRKNHTAYVTEDKWGRLVVIDSQKDGANPRLYEEWLSKYNYTFVIARPNPHYYELSEIDKSIWSKVGLTLYDFKGLLQHAWYNITGRWVGKRGYEFLDTERRVCSVFLALEFDLPNPHKVSPEKFYKYCEKNYHKFTII